MHKHDIDIFLITYNRVNKLEATLDRLLAEDSPIKNYEIKIQDNASTDDTERYCRTVMKKHPNIVYTRNKINIGPSGNAIKAMESAAKKWLWILCDDDGYDWSHWYEIDTALSSGGYDIVHTTYTKERNETYPYIINEEGFLPTSIYNTKHVTPLTMHNAYGIAYTLFPQLAIGCKVINEKGSIFVPKGKVVLQGTSDKYNFVRIQSQGLFHRFANYQVLAGMIAAYQLIEDPEIRRTCYDILCLGNDFKYSMGCFLEWNKGYINNIADILIAIDIEQKKTFFEAMSEAVPEKSKSFTDFIREIYPLVLAAEAKITE